MSETVIYDDLLMTGTPDDLWKAFEHILKQVVDHKVQFKIGVTTDAEVRAEAHEADGWESMFLVYRTSSKSRAGRVEKALIAACKDLERCENERGGGGGVIDDADEYLIYVLTDPRLEPEG